MSLIVKKESPVAILLYFSFNLQPLFFKYRSQNGFYQSSQVTLKEDLEQRVASAIYYYLLLISDTSL